MNTKKQRQRGIMPISNLCWIGQKEQSELSAEQRSNFLKNYFPDAKWKLIEFDPSEQNIIPQKVALLYKEWSEQKVLNEMGIVCENPVGFESWNSFIDFIRMEPPALLWKLKSEIADIPKKVLVPVDFSSGTERMIPMIKKIVGMSADKEIVLLNLFKYHNDPKDHIHEMNLKKDKIEEMEWYFEANLDRDIREKLVLDAMPKVGTDNANLLDQYIDANAIDLVVLGSHNFSHYHYLLYGSTVRDVLKKELTAHVCVIF